jgi:succinate dehydrogenase assembly factor 2
MNVVSKFDYFSRTQNIAGVHGSSGGSDTTDNFAGEAVTIPEYTRKSDETIDTQRARLVYQSRKRGTLENGLLLSTFASQHLNKLTAEQLNKYDLLINQPSNDWDIYYWIVRKNKVPKEYDTDVMAMLQEHAMNKNNEKRMFQPSLD